MSETMILPSSDEAAQQVTVTGWRSREGLFYGNDERIARWAGATHVECSECGKPTPKPWRERFSIWLAGKMEAVADRLSRGADRLRYGLDED